VSLIPNQPRAGDGASLSDPADRGPDHDEHPLSGVALVAVLERIDPRLILIVTETGHIRFESTMDRERAERTLEVALDHVRRGGGWRQFEGHL
jgi:hypothetical protein